VVTVLLSQACSETRSAELFRLRSDCATLASAVYQREQRDHSTQAFPQKVWEMRSRYDARRNRCYVAYRIGDDNVGQHVVYDAQTNQLIGGGNIPLFPNPGAGSGTVWLGGRQNKMATFADFEAWFNNFMKDE
jgi:hypothetical protein